MHYAVCNDVSLGFLFVSLDPPIRFEPGYPGNQMLQICIDGKLADVIVGLQI